MPLYTISRLYVFPVPTERARCLKSFTITLSDSDLEKTSKPVHKKAPPKTGGQSYRVGSFTGRITRAFLRYKLLPVICRPGWLSPFNFVPDKISHPAGHQQSTRMFKIVPDDFFEPPTARFVAGYSILISTLTFSTHNYCFYVTTQRIIF